MKSPQKPIVYYIPCEQPELDGSWFHYPDAPLSEWNNMPLMRYCLEQSGYQFKVTDGSEYESEADLVEKVIVFNVPYFDKAEFYKSIPKTKKVIFLWEP